MSGAPRAMYESGEFIAVRRVVVEALGSWEAAGVWQRLCWRAERDGVWVATVAQVAEDCCLSEHKTRAALAAIRQAGWVTAERASGRDRTLAWAPVWAEASVESPRYVVGDFPATPLSETAETEEPPKPPTPDVEPQGALIALPSPSVPVSAGFDAFWELYPRKVSKGTARRAYAAARKKASDEVILDGLRAHLPDLLSRDMGYRPHASTWLNGERWADDPGHAVQRTGPRNYDLEALMASNAGQPSRGASDPATVLAMTMLGGGR